MKRILILLLLTISIGAKSQSIIDHLGKIRMRYNNSGSNDTTWMFFVGDSVYYYSPTNPFHKFNGGIIIDSMKIKNGNWLTSLVPSQWTTSGSDIYYNAGNVGIGTNNPTNTLFVNGTTTFNLSETNNAFRIYDEANAYDYLTVNIQNNELIMDSTNNINISIGKPNPVYKLDVNGLIGGSNIETNGTSYSTKIGLDAGLNENKSAVRNNVFIGYEAGTSLTTGTDNTLVGIGAGSLSNGSGNVYLGAFSGSYETGSNKLFIDNQDRTSEANARVSSLIYGEFSATPASQLLRINGQLESQNMEANINSLSTRLGYQSGATENESSYRGNVFIGYTAGNKLTTGTANVFIGLESGYNTTIGTDNVCVGIGTGQQNIEGDKNTFIGGSSGANTTGDYNTFLGKNSGYSNTSGASNIFIGYGAGYRNTMLSNRLIVNNYETASLAEDSTRSIIYGVMAADPLDQTLTINAKTNLHVHTGLFGRKDPYNTTVADTWQTIKMDSVCADRTTSGFVFNADSTGVIIKFNGFIQFNGHAKILNNAASQQTASLYFRLRKNSIEQSQFNTAVGRTFPANGAHDLVSATGIIPVSLNDTLTVQLRTSNTNIDLEQIDSGIFTNQSSFCIFLTQVKSLKEFE